MSRWLSDHVWQAGVASPPGWRWWTTAGDDIATAPAITTLIEPGDTVVLGPEPPRPRMATVELALVSASGTDCIRQLVPGVHRVGGSPDDDVTVPHGDVPDDAAVIEVHASGAVDVRRRRGIDGGDEDSFFGSPTAGRAVRFTAAAVAAPAGARFRLGTVTLVVRRTIDESGGDGRRASAVNRTPYRPVQEGPRLLGEIPAPPSAPRASRMAVTSLVVPLASGIGMAVLLGRPQFLLIVLLAPIALAVVHAVQRRRGRRTFAAERARHRERLADRLASTVEEAAAARADAHRALPPAEHCLDVVLARGSALWQRAAGGPHLLRARIGLTDRPGVVEAPIAPGGDVDLRAEAQAALARAARPPGPVPADIDLDAAVAVGVCGPVAAAAGLVRSMLAQFATHHGPEDIVLTAILSPDSAAALDGIAWLPHTRSEASPISVRPVAVWADDVDRLVGALVDVAAHRSAPGVGRDRASVPRVVLVVDQLAAVDRGALARLLDLAPGSGIRVLWFGGDASLVPRQCRVTVHVADGADESLVESTDPTIPPEACTIEPFDRTSFGRLGRSLAPCHDAASPSRSGSLPAALTLGDLLGTATEATAVMAAWRKSDGGSLAAPIGVDGAAPVALDLVAHGPHALVAGTSGSGKSELLQTWVTSMAAHHPPERCTFLFVDYKGGATAAPFVDLPHTVGSVTNLDPRLAQRALVSLRAELDRRMAALSGRAKDLQEFAAVVPDECPPRLVIVVDEFATLVKEIPDFVAGVVDVAQRGRSLGIHLVLATQRPAGAVNDDILANTNVRIALRVVDAADSRSIIGTDDAAGISTSRRGRAFLRLGPGNIRGLQVAWSTAPVSGPRRVGGATRMLGTPPPVSPGHGDGGTQLVELVAAIAGAHRDGGGRSPRRPWVPELPPVVTLGSVDGDTHPTDPGRVITIGLSDDPARQRRRPASVDLEATGGLVVFGTGGSGRTTALRTAAVSAVDGASADEVQLLVFDFAGRALRALGDLPQARAVVTGDDHEGACREVEWLDAELERRRQLLGESHAEVWSAVADRRDRPPRLCVVIDGFAGVRAALDSAAGHAWWERLVRVLVDGRQVGIHAIMSADRRNDLPAPLLGSVGARLALRMAEAEAMTTLGVARAVARSAELPVGRGFLDGEEVQVAVLDSGEDGCPTGEREAAAVAAVADRSPGPPAPRAPGLPRVLRTWPADSSPCVDAAGAPIGVDEWGRVVRLPVDKPVLVAGPHGSGRSNLLCLMVDHLARSGSAGLRIVCVADDRSPLSAKTASSMGDLVVVTDAATAAEALTSAGERALEQTLLVVDDAERFDVQPFAGLVTDWLERGRPAIVAADRAAVGRSLSGMLGHLRRLPQMVVLQPDGGPDVEGITNRRTRFRPGTTFPVGRAVLSSRREQNIVQLKLNETS